MRAKFTIATLSGVVAGLGLVLLYILVMSLGLGSLSYTISELSRLKYWLAALTISFGIHIGLFRYIRMRSSMMQKGMVSASAATSTTAMIACCAHHLTDVVPLIGVSVIATVLTKYQVWFLAVGVFSNLVGIGLLIRNIRRMHV